MSLKLRLTALLLLLAFIFSGCVDKTPVQNALSAEETESVAISQESLASRPERSKIAVHFLDVGQADATLITLGDKAMLIDGGNRGDSELMYSYISRLGIDCLDYVVATHVHEDHIGGLAAALNAATVGTVYCPTTEYSSEIFKNFSKYVKIEGAKISVPTAGDSFELGGAKVQILACNVGKEINNTSIVLRLSYGSTSFLFTGDAERMVEQYILDAGYDIASTVLKVGHHGSESSTSYPFLRAVMPKVAIVSVGKDNSHGHPDEVVLSRLKDAEASVYRTDLEGTVVIESNGTDIKVLFPDK